METWYTSFSEILSLSWSSWKVLRQAHESLACLTLRRLRAGLLEAQLSVRSERVEVDRELDGVLPHQYAGSEKVLRPLTSCEHAGFAFEPCQAVRGFTGAGTNTTHTTVWTMLFFTYIVIWTIESGGVVNEGLRGHHFKSCICLECKSPKGFCLLEELTIAHVGHLEGR